MLETPWSFRRINNNRIIFGTFDGIHTVISEMDSLVFASDGQTVLNKKMEVMQNGDDLKGAKGGAYCSLAIRHVKQNKKYFLFTGRGSYSFNNIKDELYYHVIDLKLDNGNGSILADKKNVLLSTGMIEPISYVKTCEGYWLIAKENSFRFKSYKIDKRGLDTNAVISEVAENVIYQKNDSGIYDGSPFMDVSFDGNLLALSYNGKRNFIDVFNLNLLTGGLTKKMKIDLNPGERSHGIAFSRFENILFYMSYEEDSLRLYKVIINSDQESYTQEVLYQFKNSVPYTGSERAFLIDQNDDIVFSNDWNIIRLSNDGLSLDTVSNAELSKTNLLLASQLAPPHKVIYFPELIHREIEADTVYICKGEKIKLYTGPHLSNIVWNDSIAYDTLEIDQEGMYVMSASDATCTYFDTIYVNYKSQSLPFNKKYQLCDERELVINPPEGLNDLIWQNGSTDSLIVSIPGFYKFSASIGECILNDSIEVVEAISYENVLDTSTCGHAVSINLDPRLNDLVWNDGSNELDRTLKDGNYHFKANLLGCEVHDTFRVDVVDVPEFDKDISICPLDSMTIKLSSGISVVEWSDGYKSLDALERTFYSQGLYSFSYHYMSCVFYDTVAVRKIETIPTFTLDSILCRDEFLEVSLSAPYENIEWNDGQMGGYRILSEPGTYSFKAIYNDCRVEGRYIIENKPTNNPPILRDTLKICFGEALPNIDNVTWNSEPELTKTFQVVKYNYVDSNKCVIKADVLLEMEKCSPCKVILPNILSQNSGITSIAYNNCDVEIEEFTLLDRWGNIVCDLHGLSPGSTVLCNNFSELIPGVYAYVLVMIDEHGSPFRFVGDITIVK